jgi:hypothetical protein
MSHADVTKVSIVHTSQFPHGLSQTTGIDFDGAVCPNNTVEICTGRRAVLRVHKEPFSAAHGKGTDVVLNSIAASGNLRIGNGCKIGAMVVVLCDMPDGATAVGARAKIILAKDIAAL